MHKSALFAILQLKTETMKRSLFLLILINIISCSEKKLPATNNNEENSYHKKARVFRNALITDSAFYYYTIAKDEYAIVNDSLRAGQALVNMAILETAKGDFYGSIETSLEANNFLKNTKDPIVRRDLASSYNNMGIASSFMYNYDDAIDFYKNAIKYSANNENRLIYYNNIAVSLLAKREAKEAKKYLQQAILAKDVKTYSKAVNNLAKANLIEDANYNPLPEYYKALQIRQDNDDLEGLNSSYSALSDYFKERDPNRAFFFANKMLETAIKVNNPEDKMQALQKLMVVDPQNTSKYFKSFKHLNDSLIIARSRAKNQFAYVRYGIEKEKAENQSLKIQKAEKEIQLLYRNIGISALILALIAGFFWIRRRKKRLEQEKELEIKNTQLKISKKVHDVVANGIYQVMTKIENQEHFDKDTALDELEFVYEKSRDISYEKVDSNDTLEFYKKISNLIGSFKNEKVNTFLAGNGANIWMDLSHSVQDEVYQIMRELLVNMKKHSQANLVAFKFERNNNLIQIQYTDNGIGIPGEIIHGNGLANTVSRIEKIKGSIIFDNTIEKGLKVYISFPIS